MPDAAFLLIRLIMRYQAALYAYCIDPCFDITQIGIPSCMFDLGMLAAANECRH